jgi:hypothetical protein
MKSPFLHQDGVYIGFGYGGHTKLVWTQYRGGYSLHSLRPLIFLLHNTYIEDRASPSSTYKERLHVYNFLSDWWMARNL